MEEKFCQRKLEVFFCKTPHSNAEGRMLWQFKYNQFIELILIEQFDSLKMTKAVCCVEFRISAY